MSNCWKMITFIILCALIVLLVPAFYKLQRTSLQYAAVYKANVNKTLIIVYNRAPKCGSSFMLRLFDTLSQKYRKFVHEHSRDYQTHWLSTADKIQLTQSLSTRAHDFHGRPVLYDRHISFFYMAPTSTSVFKFINMIRDPLKQVLSAFDFTRYKYFSNPFSDARRRLTPSVANLTMNECVMSNHSARCLDHDYTGMWMVSIFCGQSMICKREEKGFNIYSAVALAKSNIEQFYTWVGVLEYLESSLELLEYQLPSIFFGITELYRKTMKQKRANVTPNEYRHPITNSTRAILLRLLAPEYEFYEFVRQRLMNDYRRAFQKEASPTT